MEAAPRLTPMVERNILAHETKKENTTFSCDKNKYDECGNGFPDRGTLALSRIRIGFYERLGLLRHHAASPVGPRLRHAVPHAVRGISHALLPAVLAQIQPQTRRDAFAERSPHNGWGESKAGCLSLQTRICAMAEKHAAIFPNADRGIFILFQGQKIRCFSRHGGRPCFARRRRWLGIRRSDFARLLRPAAPHWNRDISANRPSPSPVLCYSPSV